MMRSTGQAIAQGLCAGAEQKERWRGLRGEFERQAAAAIGRGKLDLAMVLAVQGQLCREALEAEEIVARQKETVCGIYK